MARIRTIKPEFWTDEKIIQLPFYVRLIFIGLWNFCDDEGFVIDEPERLSMQIMPGDNIDMDAAIDLLDASGLVERYLTIEGKRVLFIPHFLDHQKVSHPTTSKFSLENSRKIQITTENRRQVAIKYNCPPGGNIKAECYSCGAEGNIWWPKNSKGKPGYWISISNLELSHFIAESKGGQTTENNIVLCCRFCNRSMHKSSPLEYIIQKIPENSGVLRPEGKGIEGKGIEGKGKTSAINDDLFNECKNLYKDIPDFESEWKIMQEWYREKKREPIKREIYQWFVKKNHEWKDKEHKKNPPKKPLLGRSTKDPDYIADLEKTYD